MTNFVHLRVHTDYSMRDGLMDVKAVVQNAKALGFPAIAITDFMNQCNTIKLFEQTRSQGLKPIYGIDLNVYDDSPTKESICEFFTVTLLAMNDLGYRNIVELESNAWRRGDLDHQTCINLSWLSKFSEGIILLSGGVDGDIGKGIIAGKEELVKKRLEFYLAHFKDRFYLEVSRLKRPHEESYIEQALLLAVNYDLPIVATNKVMFLKREDFQIHKIRVAIQDKVLLSDEHWVHPYTEEMYFKTANEMAELFKDIPEALENSYEIAKRCTVTLHIGKNFLPRFPTGNLTAAEYLKKEAYEGLEKRLEFLYPDKEERDKQRPRYITRLETELDVIIRMDFPGYFLIVMEFIQWSKNNHVPVGPGRGSGGGSLVAYAIKITDFDPLAFDLLFERFLNPERVSMPDFDVDFCMDNRGKVIQHVAEKYGRQSVSQIITFGTLAAKASIKSVARCMGFSYSFGDGLAKLIPSKPLDITLKQAIFENEDKTLKNRYEKEEDVHTVLDIAMRLEGITTSNGKHAGGVVISPTCITDFAPLMCDSDGLDFKTQFDKHDVEEAGLVKFDFLGLRTLTIIDWALEMINERMRREGKELVDISKIDLADPKAYEVLKSGETTAIFQLESRGMRDLIRKMQPDCFEDMIALVALYRPGPIGCGMVDNFVNRKHGLEQVAYPHPDFQHPCLKPILEPTYGIVVYQEQVMQIAQALAGYTLGGADLLRRAMGKKKPEEMAKQRCVFKKGAEDRGIDGDLAMKIFDQVEKFAGYGFNKSHSAAYALVSFQTLWLKTHFPAEFLAAMMTADKENAEKIVVYVNECRRLGIKILPPSINEGQIHFIVNKSGEIIYSLGAIKGVGEGPVAEFMREREENGPFKSIFDFARRVDGKVINRRILEALINAGAMDGLGPHRAALLNSVDTALKLSQETKQNKDSGDFDIFAAFEESEFDEPEYEDCKPLSDLAWRKGEIDTLGLYLTGHPIDQYLSEIKNITRYSIGEIHPADFGEEKKEIYTVAGIVIKVENRKTKDGKSLLNCIIEDYTGKLSITIWNEDIDKYSEIIKENELLIVSGIAGYDNFNKCTKLSPKSIMNIAMARSALAKAVRIFINEDNMASANVLDEIVKQANSNPGNVPLEVILEHKNGLLISPSEIKIEPNNQLLENLRFVTGYDTTVVYAKPAL